MKRIFGMSGLAIALALPLLAAPGSAHASCADRKLTGTVVGGVGGALIGNSISRGGGGAIIGGLGGAVIGHEIAGSGCRRYRSEYRSGPRQRSYRGEAGAYAGQPARYVYYDAYGNAVAGGDQSAKPLRRRRSAALPHRDAVLLRRPRRAGAATSPDLRPLTPAAATHKPEDM